MKITVLILFLTTSYWSVAQVEHNFEVGPQKTDCHRLPAIKKLSLDSAIVVIKSSNYRFKQSISVSRYRIPQKMSYYSCDGTKGYAIAQEDEKTFKIYRDMPKSVWDAFLSARDPIAFYKTESFAQYLLPEKINDQ